MNKITSENNSLCHANNFEDIIQADKTRNIGVISMALMSYLDTRPEENLATIDCALRTNQCWSYLFAQEPIPGVTPILRGEPRQFSLFITTRDPLLAQEEVLQKSGDPETNRARLYDTGFGVITELNDAVQPLTRRNVQLTPEGVEFLISRGICKKVIFVYPPIPKEPKK